MRLTYQDDDELIKCPNCGFVLVRSGGLWLCENCGRVWTPQELAQPLEEEV